MRHNPAQRVRAVNNPLVRSVFSLQGRYYLSVRILWRFAFIVIGQYRETGSEQDRQGDASGSENNHTSDSTLDPSGHLPVYGAGDVASCATESASLSNNNP